jgi:hypothetical protein
MHIPLGDLPNEILEELNSRFRKVTFENYGKPTRGTRPSRLLYVEYSQIKGIEKYCDPMSFDEELVDGTTHVWVTRYAARGKFDNGVADVYSITRGKGVRPLD